MCAGGYAGLHGMGVHGYAQVGGYGCVRVCVWVCVGGVLEM